MLINQLRKMHQIVKKWLSDFCSIQRVKKATWLDEVHFARIVFSLKDMILDMGRVCNKDTSTKFISFYKLMTFFLLWLLPGQFLIQLSPPLSCCSVSNTYCWWNTSYWIIEKLYILQARYKSATLIFLNLLAK